MEASLYVVIMPKCLRNCKLHFRSFFFYNRIKTVCMLVFNVIDNGLACGVCRVLIMAHHCFCKRFIPLNWVALQGVFTIIFSM